MNADSLRLLVMEDFDKHIVKNMIFNVNEMLEVLDLCTRATIRIRAAELSLYRHTLFMRGKSYRILNMHH